MVLFLAHLILQHVTYVPDTYRVSENRPDTSITTLKRVQTHIAHTLEFGSKGQRSERTTAGGSGETAAEIPGETL